MYRLPRDNFSCEFVLRSEDSLPKKNHGKNRQIAAKLIFNTNLSTTKSIIYDNCHGAKTLEIMVLSVILDRNLMLFFEHDDLMPQKADFCHTIH